MKKIDIKKLSGVFLLSSFLFLGTGCFNKSDDKDDDKKDNKTTKIEEFKGDLEAIVENAEFQEFLEEEGLYLDSKDSSDPEDEEEIQLSEKYNYEEGYSYQYEGDTFFANFGFLIFDTEDMEDLFEEIVDLRVTQAEEDGIFDKFEKKDLIDAGDDSVSYLFEFEDSGYEIFGHAVFFRQKNIIGSVLFMQLDDYPSEKLVEEILENMEESIEDDIELEDGIDLDEDDSDEKDDEDEDEIQPNGEMKTFKDQEKGFMFDYPSEWNIQDQGGMVIASNLLGDSFNVIAMEPEIEGDLEDLLDKSVDELETIFGDSVGEISSSKTKLDRKDAIKIEYDYSFSGAELKITQYILFSGDMQYVVTVSQMSDSRADLDDILNSFEII